MFQFITYNTPKEFYLSFLRQSILSNFKTLKVLSLLGLILTVLSRIIGLIYLKDLKGYPTYAEFSFSNWFAMFGHGVFFCISFVSFEKLKYSRFINFLFAVFVLAVGLYMSYVNSSHNTKNTLMMLLVSILVVGVFFVFETIEIWLLTTLLAFAYVFSIVTSKIVVMEIVLNIAAGLILSVILFLFLKYAYYFKSQHYVKVQELKQKNYEVELLSRQKNDVLAYVVHDLRSPLANIEMLNDFILSEEPSPIEARLIKQSTEQANHIINDLLDALKYDEVDEVLPLVDIKQLLERLIKQWQQVSGRVIQGNIADNAVFVKANPSKLERVFENIFQNANKFSLPNLPIDITLEVKTKTIQIQIKDDGIGIPNDLLLRIFDQFTSAGRKGLQGEKSIGIGLHISKKIVEQYEGTLSVMSIENEGSTFTICLPLAMQ